MTKLISYEEVSKLTKMHKSTLAGYRKKIHKDGNPVFPEPCTRRNGGGEKGSVYFIKSEVLKGIERIKEYREQAKLNKIKSAQAKNKIDARDRLCKAPDNYNLAFKLMNQCLHN